MPNVTVLIVSIISMLLVISAITKLISKYTKIPFTILLVIAGMLLGWISQGEAPIINRMTSYNSYPNILLFICLPALIFEATFTMDGRLLRKNLGPILILSIPGLVVCSGVIALIIHVFTSFDLLTSLLLGAILSSIDSVAVVSVFRQLGTPKRLAILIEGESLFNSSTAFVIVKTLLFVAGASFFTTHELVMNGISQFCLNFFGGIAVGMALTFLINLIISMMQDDILVVTALTISLAWMSFIIAESLGVSGVMSTITASILMADWGRTKISAETEKSIRNILGFIAYIVNSLIFILVGFSVNFSILLHSWGTLVVVILALLIGRAVMIFGFTPLICNKLPNLQPISLRYQIISWISGIQGALGITLALTLTTIPNHELIISMVMGVVLFTIIIQGSLIVKMIHWLKLDVPPISDEFATIEAEIAAENMTLERIPVLQGSGLFSMKIAKNLKATCKRDIEANMVKLEELKANKLNPFKERRLLYLSCFSEEKFLYLDMYNKGHFSEPAYRILNHNIDMSIDAMRYHGNVVKKTPATTLSNFLVSSVINIFRRFPLLHHLTRHIRIRQIIIDYEVHWGIHEGVITVLHHLDKTRKTKAFKDSVIDKVEEHFRYWLHITTTWLDDVAEQFPEFVNDMQKRFAQRILLYAKSEAIQNQVKQGLLPSGIAERILQRYAAAIRELSKDNPARLQLQLPHLIKKIPFFKGMNAKELEEARQFFTEYHAQADEEIIRQGYEGDSMYIIVRGVVRVVAKRGRNKINLSTLMAGDFFGEIAMLHSIKRTATCKAVTPCILYVLTRDDFEELARRFPSIQQRIELTGSRRKLI